MVKIVVIHGSTHYDKGNIGYVLEPFIKGLKVGGASVEIIYPSKLNIKPTIRSIDNRCSLILNVLDLRDISKRDECAHRESNPSRWLGKPT